MRRLSDLRYRAPVSLLTFAAFWGSIAAPVTAFAQQRSAEVQVAAPDTESSGGASDVAESSAAESARGRVEAGGASVKDVGDGDSPAEGPSDPQPTSLPIGGSKNGVTGGVGSLPGGAGTLGGMGESFSAQLSTGIGTNSVPFALLSARGASQPSLALSYASSSGTGNAGMGWSVGSLSIARQTDRGLPTYDDRAAWYPNQDRFVFGGGEELVPICDVTPSLGCSGALPEEQMPAWSAGWQYHRARLEGAFVRFFWSPDRRTWRVQSKSGQVAELGVPLDGSDYTGAIEHNPTNANQIFAWYVSREYDTYTDSGASDGKPLNPVYYRYLDDDGTTYLTDIFDTSPADDPTTLDLGRFAHHTRLVWGDREDRSRSYRSGWETKQNLRLARVDISSASAGNWERALVRRYELNYDPGYHVSLLSSVRELGRCPTPDYEDEGAVRDKLNCTPLSPPPLSFSYSHVGAPTTDGWEPFANDVRSIAGSPPHDLDEVNSDVFDVNADGLPDVLVTAKGVHGDDYTWFENGGAGELDSFGTARGIDIQPLQGANATTLQFSNLNLLPLDLDGDGRVNLLHMPTTRSYGVYGFEPKGAEFVLAGRVVNLPSDQQPAIDLTNDAATTQVVDVNADGLVDVVVSTGDTLKTYFALGRLPGGDGRFGTGALTSAKVASLDTSPVRKCLPFSSSAIDFADPGTTIADMNADGLPDIVRVRPGSVLYWPGRGNGYWGTGDVNGCPAQSYASSRHVTMANPPTFGGALPHVADVNGDGYPDLVNPRFGEVDVFINVNGESWSARKIISGTPNSTDQIRIVDVDGSGTRDILWGSAGNYRYVDLQGGQRPWVLTQVSNGLGRTTSIEYTSSIDEMLSAKSSGNPWQSVVPMALHLVKRVTVSNNLSAFGHGPTNLVTEYSYRDPVYDGRQREFRGFRETTTTNFGDANSPTSHVRSEHLLGECVYPNGTACAPSDQTFENPREALKGLGVVTEAFDDRGVYLSTSHSHYALRKLYQGLDGRGVTYAFADGGTSWRYDTANPSVFAASSSVALETVRSEPSVSGLAVDAPDLVYSVRIRASGAVRTEGAVVVDDFGNATESVARGCVAGCAGGGTDDVIHSVTEPTLLPHDSGWLWRTVRNYLYSRDFPEPRGDSTSTYTPAGAPESITAVLTGTEELQRFHESGSPVAPTPANAVSDDPALFVASTEYDEFGNALRIHGAEGRCSDVFYEPLYAQFATTGMMYPGGCPASRSLNNPPPGTLYSGVTYDRGLEQVTYVVDVEAQVTHVEYDGLGRTVNLFRSDPSGAGLETVPALRMEYYYPTKEHPYSVIAAFSRDGADATDVIESYSYLDGMGRTIVALAEADPSANDDGKWVVGGFVDYDAKGAVARSYLPKFWDGNPTEFPITSPPGTSYGRAEFDAFGRQVRLYDLDGTQTLQNTYHALSSDSWDAADLEQGGVHYGTFASVFADGHGRGVRSVERFKEGSSIVERETRGTFLPSGELLSQTRSSVHGSTTRWLRYDSLGRMVLNVEPHTSVNFNPSPDANAASIRAWRYRYNAAGELVGTSDARGCGTNYAYDGVGRVVYEDYSPCLDEHQSYSPPTFNGASPTGVEAYYHYDTIPTQLGLPQVQVGSNQSESFISAAPELLRGKLVATFDRAKATWINVDARGRPFESWVRLTAPGAPSDDLGQRYAGRWYRKQVGFDDADRVVWETTGARSPQLMGADGQSRVELAYAASGAVKSVAGSYGTLISQLKRTADGLQEFVEYGDLAATRTQFAYDSRRRLESVQTFRGPPAAWSNPPANYSLPPDRNQATFQKVLQDDHFIYDVVGNPLVVEDLRNPDEWPAGAKPVTRRMQYDDLYRVTRVDYGYSQGDELVASHAVSPAPMGIGPHATVAPRIKVRDIAELARAAAQRPDATRVSPRQANDTALKSVEVVGKATPAAAAEIDREPAPLARPDDHPSVEPPLREAPATTQGAELAPKKSVGKLDAKYPDLSGVEAPSPTLDFAKVTTTSPTSYYGPTRPTYYWNRVGNATSYRIETIDSDGFQHEFVASPSAAHCSASGSNCYYYPPTGSGVANPYLPTGAARFRVVPTTSGFPITLASDWRLFGVGNASAPVAGTLMLPAGITNINSRAIFTRGTHVSRFRVFIRDVGGNVVHDSSDYTAYDSCVDGRCGVILPTLSAGTYTIWLQFENEHGVGSSGPWSPPIVFTTHAEAPAPFGPVGSVSNSVWLTFGTVSGATEYRVEYSGPSGDVATVDFLANTCSSGFCGTYLPSLASGAWRWRVYALIGGTYRQPSAYVPFSIGSIPSVTAPTLSAPASSVTSPVQFTWNQGAGTSRFSVEIKNSSGNLAVPTLTLPKSQFGCMTQGSLCTYYGPTLPAGNYTWRVAALNEHDTTVWSGSQSFSVSGTVITQLAPQGAISTTRPTYRWIGPTDVDVYELAIIDGSGRTFYNDYSLEDLGCEDGSPCEITPAFDISDNTSSRWYVRAYGGVLDGTMSAYMTFSRGTPQPVGDASNLQPTTTVGSPLELSWTPGANSSTHYIQVYNSAGTMVLNTVRQRDNTNCVGSGTTCRLPYQSLPSGDYTFYIRARSETSYANWVGPVAFSIDKEGPSPLTPNTNFEGATPAFKFTARQNATNYQLLIVDAYNVYRYYNVTPAAAGCVDGGQCSYTPGGLVLPNGASRWGVRATTGVSTSFKYQNFAVGSLLPVQAPFVLTPTGVVGSPFTATWQADPGSSSYEFEFTNGSGQVIESDELAAYDDLDCVPGTTDTCRFSMSSLPSGNYTLRVRGYNVHGNVSQWSNTVGFSIDGNPPTPIGPTGALANALPTYRFTPAAPATNYRLWLSDMNGLRYRDIAPASLDCSSGNCFVHPNDLPVATGAAQWGISALVNGSWTTTKWLEISYGSVAPLGTSSGLNPQGNVLSPISFEWSANVGASKYVVRVFDSGGGIVLNQATDRVAAGCGAGTGDCSLSNVSLAPGEYTWSVQTQNPQQLGSWSTAIAFTVGELPSGPTVLAPTGTLSDTLPAYSWTAEVANASYQLTVTTSSGGVVLQQSFSPASASCVGAIANCSVTPSVVLRPGSYSVKVEATNAFGSTEGASQSFEVDAPSIDQDDAWDDPNLAVFDPRRADPAPYQQFDSRIRNQTWSYDWLGNSLATDDDSHAFYDRSIGTAQHGAVGGKAYQLTSASNRTGAGSRPGDLRATYDVTGNLTELRVDHDGTCSSSECSQIFQYDWDEVGRLVTARRWDAEDVDTHASGSSGPADVELHYTYDAGDSRVVKRAVDGTGNQSYTLYIFNSLELRKTQWDDTAQDFILDELTEVAYLFAHGSRLARLAYEPAGAVPSIDQEQLHVFFELGDHLGSTSVVLDKATSELVERSTYQAYGATESDYRPDRWKNFREDYRFTGKEEDVEVGLVYFGKRFLNPLMNRWVSADPLAVHGLGADPNLYAYVSGRVLQATDPIGLAEEAPQPEGNIPPGGNEFTVMGCDQLAPGTCVVPGGGESKTDRPTFGFKPKYGGLGAIPDEPKHKPKRPKRVTPKQAPGPTGQNAGGDDDLSDIIPEGGSGRWNNNSGHINGSHTPNPEARSLGRQLFQDFVPIAGSLDTMYVDENATDDEKGMALITFTLEAATFGLGSEVKMGVKGAKWGWRGLKAGVGHLDDFARWGKRLVAVCKSGPCPCFAAGTDVDLGGVGTPIEEIELGDRVGPESELCSSLDFSAWKRVDLRMVVDNNGELDEVAISLLRPEAWIERNGVVAGEYSVFDLDELNVAGPAYVTAVGDSVAVDDGVRCPATGLIRHVSRDVIELNLDGEAEPIHVTRSHPLFSETRGEWTAAGDLVAGEYVRTRDASVRVEQVGDTYLPPTEVFNLEVAVEHYYYVGDTAAWVHNNCVGFAADTVHTAFSAMRGGGGHAMRHLIDEGLIKNSGSLASRRGVFQDLVSPVLINPVKTFDWKVGGTMARAFAGDVGGKKIVVFVAKEGKYQTQVLSAILPDAAQIAQWGL